MRLFEVMQKRQIAPPESVCDAMLQAVPRTAANHAIVSTLVKRAVQENYCLQRKSLERVVEMITQEDMPAFAQLVQRRKAVEDREEAEYEAELKRKNEEKRLEEEKKKQKELEEKKKREEEKKLKEPKSDDEKQKKKKKT